MVERLTLINRSFDNALLIAPDRKDYAAPLRALGKFDAIRQQAPRADDSLDLARTHILPSSACLICIPSTMCRDTWRRSRNALKPDGLALFGFLRGRNLARIARGLVAGRTGSHRRCYRPRVAPMIDLRETGGLLQRAGLALPVADVERTTIRYADAMSLMREIKTSGFANCLVGRSRRFATPSLFMQAAMAYPADADGRISATVEIAWAAAWKPHASQQKPLKPGSAKARLADALKVEEGKL